MTNAGGQPSNNGRGGLIALTVVATLWCASCATTSTPTTGAALKYGGGDKETICVTASPTHEHTFGAETLTNQSNKDLRIDSATLVGAHGVTALETALAPIENTTLVGVMDHWPPTDANPEVWSKLRPLPAPLTDTDGDMNLVVRVRYDKLPARFDSVRVTYTANGTRKVRDGTVALEIKEKCF